MYSEPLEGITVQAWERRFSQRGPTAEPIIDGARFPQTDDRGHYRIHGLQPSHTTPQTGGEHNDIGSGRVRKP